MGKITGICISEKRGVQKHFIEEANIIADWGIEGDAHGGKHHGKGLIGAPHLGLAGDLGRQLGMGQAGSGKDGQLHGTGDVRRKNRKKSPETALWGFLIVSGYFRLWVRVWVNSGFGIDRPSPASGLPNGINRCPLRGVTGGFLSVLARKSDVNRGIIPL